MTEAELANEVKYNQQGQAKYDKLQVYHCGVIMKSIGLWPNKAYDGCVSSYHCPTCNSVSSIVEPNVKLVAETIV